MTGNACWCSFVSTVTYRRITSIKGLRGRATKLCLEQATESACRVILWTCVRCWTPIFGTACFLKTCLTCRQRCSSLWAEWTESQRHSKRSFPTAFALTRPSSRFEKHRRACVSAIGTEKQERQPRLRQIVVSARCHSRF